ncbi:MAG: TonB-dependent receptor plug [Gemmatimonadetes bacterium]|nr:TonB-dependent receptor plug [Gemmatimonadota bacterium]
MMTRLTFLCAAAVLCLGNSPASALPATSVAPAAATRTPAAATISGHVTDAQGNRPLANAQVLVVGTQLRAITNAEGRYSIANVPDGAHTIRAMLIGFAPQSRTVTVSGNAATVDFALAAQTVQLEAVVTVGYGQQRRQDVTGAVSSVNVSDVPVNVTANVGQMLEGRVAGAQVTQNNGAPGGGLSIHIRGTNSIAANSEPLYVIDGVPAITGTSSNDPYQNPLSSISPNDIENIEVLKDASSTAIYGARGAAGVVLITTKRGQRGRNNVTLDASYGTQTPGKKIAMLNGLQFAQMANEGRANIGAAPFYTDAQLAAIANGGAGTDWQNLVLQDARQQSYTLGVTGGDDATRYLLSGGYFDQGGIVIGSAFTRYSGRVNLERNVSKKLTAGTNLTVSNTLNKIQSSDNSLGSSTVMGSLWFNPASPVTNPDGTYVLNSPVTWPVENPVANTLGLYQQRSIFNAIGNGFGEYAFTDALKLRSSLGVTAVFDRFRYFAPRTIPAGAASQGSATDNSGENYNIINENTLNYRRQLLGNALDVLGGFTVQKSRGEAVNAGNTRFSNDILGVYGLGSGTLPTASTSYNDWALLSYLGRANYNIADKYLLTVTGRADGSSRFGANNKWGFFPSAAFAWRLIDEGFMKNQSMFSDMKLRLSYGVTGNQEIGLYNSLATLSGNNYAFGGTNVIGYATNTAAPNPDLKWETTRQSNVGLDMGWFNNRITASVDAYRSTTKDLLLSVDLPTQSGFQTQLRNVGSVQNTGLELQLNTVNFASEKFGWRSTLSAAQNANKVLALGVAQQIPYTGDKGISGQTGGAVMVIKVGEPLGSFYGLRTNGLYQEGDACPLTTKRPTIDCIPGEYKYVDTNADGKIDANDRVILGNGQPKWYGGLTNEFNSGPFNMNVFFQGSFGSKILNGPAINTRNVSNLSNQTVDALNRWTPTNTNTNVPRANVNRPRELYDVHVEDGSFIRLQSLSLGYRLPSQFVGGAENARLVVTGQNLHVWTKYTGFDPEVNSFGGDARARGVDLGAYPRARTWNVGLSMSY